MADKSKGTQSGAVDKSDSDEFPYGRPREDYFELSSHRRKDLVIKELPRIPKEKLVAFKNLYGKQPQQIQELLRIPFCDSKPVVEPSPLSTFVARVRNLQDKKKRERKRIRQRLKEEIRQKWDKAGPGLTGQKERRPTKEGRAARKAKVAVVELKREETPLVHVDYPARVVNLDKAIASMGGVGTMTEVFSSVSKKLEVKFRPDDPFCNSVRGEANPSIGVLLRVRYRKKAKAETNEQPERRPPHRKEGNRVDIKKTDEGSAKDDTVIIGGVSMSRSQILYEDSKLLKKAAQENEEFLHLYESNDLGKSYLKIPEKYETETDSNIDFEVLGLVNRSYKFDGMCDFQYLPSKSSSYGTASSRDDVFPIIGVPSDNPETLFVCDRVIHGEEMDSHAVFIPPTMSRLDRPLDTVLGHTMGFDNVKLGSNVPDKSDVVSSTRTKRNISTVFYTFLTDKQKPVQTDVPAEPLQGAVEDLKKRPTYESSLEVIKKHFDEKPVWNKVALEVESKVSLGTLKYALPCVAYFATNGPWRASWIKFGYDPRKHQSSFIYQTVDFRVPGMYKCFMEEPDTLHESFYIFKPSMIPPRGQMYYQLCHLKCDEIDKLIDTANQKAKKGELEYDVKFGWLKEGTLEYLRYAITRHIERYLQEIGKIPETHGEIITVPDGQLETQEKLQVKPIKPKRPRKVRFYKPKGDKVTISSPTKTTESKKTVGKVKATTSQWVYQGILKDLDVPTPGEDQEGLDDDISGSDEEIQPSSSDVEEEEDSSRA